MTPNIFGEEIMSRPLFDPPVGAYRAADIVKMLALRQHRMSDYGIGVLILAITHDGMKKKLVDMFEMPFIEHARPRQKWGHHGRPFRAPDGTAMAITGKDFNWELGGSDKRLAGNWNFGNVQDHPDFRAWAESHLNSPQAVDLDPALLVPFVGKITGPENADHLARTTAAIESDEGKFWADWNGSSDEDGGSFDSRENTGGEVETESKTKVEYNVKVEECEG